MFLHSEVAGAIKTIEESQRAHLCRGGGAQIPNRDRRLMWRSQNPAPNCWFTTCDAGGQNTCQSATPTASPKTGISPSVGSVGDSLRQRSGRVGALPCWPFRATPMHRVNRPGCPLRPIPGFGQAGGVPNGQVLASLSDRNLAGGLVLSLVRGRTRKGCFHYIRCSGGVGGGVRVG